jgi:hypothetical protein
VKLCEVGRFLSGQFIVGLPNSIRVDQDAVSCPTIRTSECDKTGTAANRFYGGHRLHPVLTLSANSLVRPMHGLPRGPLLDANARIS